MDKWTTAKGRSCPLAHSPYYDDGCNDRCDTILVKERRRYLNQDRFRVLTNPSTSDLAALVSAPKVDLLKIDIEGAEEAVLQEYQDVLAKPQVLVGEFHLEQINYDNCQSVLAKCGLVFQRRTYQYEDKLAVDTYARVADCVG